MNTKVLFLLFISVTICCVSCKKENGDYPPVVGKTNIFLINAGADTLNIYQNGSRLVNTGSFFTSGALGYYSINSGTQNYQLKRAGSTAVLTEFPLTLDTGKTYSLFIAGRTNDKIFLLKDALPVDTSLNALVRVVNASPMASALDVSIGSINFNNNSFKTATRFIEVKPGANTLFVYQTGISGLAIPAKTLTLLAGGIYTLFTYGVINGTGNNALGAKLIQNGQN